MKYRSSRTFRQALEDRLRAQGASLGIPLVRLRKMVAFERFLAHLLADQPNDWVLKGGLALQLRIGDKARTTNDMDLLSISDLPARRLHDALVRAGLVDLRDDFQFEVALPTSETELRFHVRTILDGRPFESFYVDVGSGDPMVDLPERLTAPALLEFAGISPAVIPCYPLTQQIAEKVHAYTRPHKSGLSSRVKDWVDILLMAELGTMDARSLSRALSATFEKRATHPLPPSLPVPPSNWLREFQYLSRELKLGYESLADAIAAMARFVDPVLQGKTKGSWNPAAWSWE